MNLKYILLSMTNKTNLIVGICCFIIISVALITAICITNKEKVKQSKPKYVRTIPNPPIEHLEGRWEKRLKAMPSEMGKAKKYFTLKPENYPQKWDNIDFKPQLIMVSVASYRDSQCEPTVQNMIDTADNPDNLRIWVCQQNEKTDEDCLGFCNIDKDSCKGNKVNIQRLDHTEARGPTWARYLIMQKWNGEEYFMQIDSHSRFKPHWDTEFIKMLKMTNSPKPCLTNYPCDYHIDSGKMDEHLLRGGLYIENFDKGDGLTRVQSEYQNKAPKKPFVSESWGACFSFSSGLICKEVSYDPYTPFLFFGEELDIAMRLFTNGWDLFSPNKTLIFTTFKRKHRKTFWEHPDQGICEKLSRLRIYFKLGYITIDKIPHKLIEEGLLTDIDRYSLGKVRSIKNFEDQAGVDFKTETIKGHNLKRILKNNRTKQLKDNDLDK